MGSRAIQTVVVDRQFKLTVQMESRTVNLESSDGSVNKVQLDPGDVFVLVMMPSDSPSQQSSSPRTPTWVTPAYDHYDEPDDHGASGAAVAAQSPRERMYFGGAHEDAYSGADRYDPAEGDLGGHPAEEDSSGPDSAEN